MKKRIVGTVISLFVFSGFLAGPWGTDLAGAEGTCVKDVAGKPYKSVTEECFGSDVEVVILVMKGNKIQIMPGPSTEFKEPKSKGGGVKTGQPPDLKEGDRGTDLPVDLGQDITTSKFKYNKIETYGNNTCGVFNGVMYCW
jgi:hypothetical protein